MFDERNERLPCVTTQHIRAFPRSLYTRKPRLFVLFSKFFPNSFVSAEFNGYSSGLPRSLECII
jgi:hypothetical protein